MNIEKIFEFCPQLTKPEYGPEKCLKDIMLEYYTEHNIPADKARDIINQYIAAIRKEFNLK